jgi:hypothetical protein
MPHQVQLELTLKQPAADTLETDLHGMIHRQLEQHQQHLPEPERISTHLHNDNQQSLSVRITNTEGNTIACEIEVLRDVWARTFEETTRHGLWQYQPSLERHGHTGSTSVVDARGPT